MLSEHWKLEKHLMCQRKFGILCMFSLRLPICWGMQQRHKIIAAVNAKPMLPSQAIANTSTVKTGNLLVPSLTLHGVMFRHR